MYSPSPSHSVAFEDLIDPERLSILDNADAFLEQLEREEKQRRDEETQKRRQLSGLSDTIPLALPVEQSDPRNISPETSPSNTISSKENIQTHVQNSPLNLNDFRDLNFSDKHDPDISSHSPISAGTSVSIESPGIGVLDTNSFDMMDETRLHATRNGSESTGMRTHAASFALSESVCTIPDSPPPEAISEPHSFSSEVEHAVPDSPPPERSDPPDEMPHQLELLQTEISRKVNSQLSPPLQQNRRFFQHQKDTPSFDKRFIQHQKDSPSLASDRSVSRSRARYSHSVIRFRPAVSSDRNDRRLTTPAGRFTVPNRLKTGHEGTRPFVSRRESAPMHLVHQLKQGEESEFVEENSSEEPESPPLTPIGTQSKTAGMIGWNQTFPKSAAASHNSTLPQTPSISKKIHEGASTITRKSTSNQVLAPVWSKESADEDRLPLDHFDPTPIAPVVVTAPVRTSIYNFEGLRLKKKYLQGDPVEAKVDGEWLLGYIECFNLDDNTWLVHLVDVDDDPKRITDVRVRKPKLEENIRRIDDRESRSETPESFKDEDNMEQYDDFASDHLELNYGIQNGLSPPLAKNRPRVVSISSTFDFSKKIMGKSPSVGAPGESFDYGRPPSTDMSSFPHIDIPRRMSEITDITLLSMDSGPSPTHTPPPPDEPVPLQMLEKVRNSQKWSNWEFDYKAAQTEESSSNYFPEIVDGDHKRSSSLSSDTSYIIPDNMNLFGAPPVEKPVVDDELVAKLTGMDFSAQEAAVALEMSNGDFDFALALLLSERDAKDAQKAKQEEKDAKLARDIRPVQYTVTFLGPKFGFEILMGKDGFGAKVGMLLSKFSKLMVVPNSDLREVEGIDVSAKTLHEIRMLMVAQMTTKKHCSIIFSVGARDFNNFQTRGTLKILVSGANASYVPISYCTVSVLEAELGTDRVKKDKNPIWNNMLVWYKYGVRASQNAVVRIWRYNRFLPNKCIGEGYFTLPEEPDTAMESVVEMKNKTGEVISVVVLKTIIQTNNLASRLWRKKK